MTRFTKTNYQSQAADTSIEADIFLFQKLKQLSLQQRIEIAANHDRGVKKLCLAGIKWRHPQATFAEIRLLFSRAVLGEKFHPNFQPISNHESMWIQDSISLAGELHQIFDLIKIPYYISRGVASSIYGEPHSTRDLDLVIQIPTNQIDLLVKTLEDARFYCPAGAVEDLKNQREKMLNITHTETIANADIYLMDNSQFANSQMSRKKLLNLEGIPVFWVISPEDLILQKLLWGKSSQSEKQWRDVLGILKLQAESLDDSYLTEWSEKLDIVDTFNQALQAVTNPEN
ncbi:MAG TPA: hypothetical protein VK184_18965 [Nostocaceae cyanobacterium]|nr:hypothetical protein [Nostocaceae cyanobacterium]